jgi:hypothetical protein
MKILFYTSIGMFIGTFEVMVYSQNPIKLICISGVTSSLLNHGTNNNYYLRTLDRFIMVSGSIIYTFYTENSYNKLILYGAISCYFLSKLTKLIYFHIMSHFLYVIFHNNLLKN